MDIKILNRLKDNMYMVIPFSCITFMAFIALIKDGFTLIPAADFPTFYYVARFIFTQPDQIYFLEQYNSQRYVYTPFFATIIAPMGLLTFEQAHWFFFFLILIITALCLVLFDRILILKNVNNKSHRLLILLALSNGIIFVQMFDCLTGRIFTAFGLIWFLKREIEYRELNKNRKSPKFVFTQMMLLVFAIGMTPPYVFLFILYLFHDVKFKEIINKFQIKRYLLVIASFFIQNFMLIVIILINPESIPKLLNETTRRGHLSLPVNSIYLSYSSIEENRYRDPVNAISIFLYVISIYFYVRAEFYFLSITLTIIATVIIHSRKNLSIEKKFGYWALISLFVFTFNEDRYFVILLPLIALLFLDNEFIECDEIIDFIKENYLLLLGYICILLLYFMPPIHYLIRLFPILIQVPLAILYLRYVFIYIIIIIVLSLLHKKTYISSITLTHFKL